MRARKSPGALAASGALEKDQLGSAVISTPTSISCKPCLSFSRGLLSTASPPIRSVTLAASSFRRADHSSTPNHLRTVIPTFRPNSQQQT
jgi:hypothetical protein